MFPKRAKSRRVARIDKRPKTERPKREILSYSGGRIITQTSAFLGMEPKKLKNRKREEGNG